MRRTIVYVPGFSFLALLQVLFIGLKLGHVIDWPWIWVLCPIWGPPALGIGFIAVIIVVVLAIVIVVALLAFIVGMVQSYRRKRWQRKYFHPRTGSWARASNLQP